MNNRTVISATYLVFLLVALTWIAGVVWLAWWLFLRLAS